MTCFPLLRSAILASLLCLVSVAGSEGAPILLDQSYAPDGVNDFSFTFGCVVAVPASSSFLCGQSFTVGLSGALTAGELYLQNASGTTSVGLYDVSNISGPPALLELSSTGVAFASPGFYSFAFSTPVTVGDNLALLFGLEDIGDSIFLRGEAPGGYAAGGRTVFIGGSLSSTTTDDLYFRTYVDINPVAVPEPASLLLLGTGLAGLSVRRCRRKRS